MGTSTRNAGQSGRTPLVPSWLEDVDTGDAEGSDAADSQLQDDALTPIPPNGDEDRFRGPRTSFTRFTSGGGRNGSSMKKAVSKYVRHSLGGSSRATKRLGAARRSTARLYSALGGIAGGGAREIAERLHLGDIQGLTAAEFFVRLASFVCPDGGTADEGLARYAYYEAILENPSLATKDIESLDSEECEAVLQRYMCRVVMGRIENDIAAKVIVLPDTLSSVARVEEQVEQLVSQSVADACAKTRRRHGEDLSDAEALRITDQIYQSTYDILGGQVG